mgnify:CR=1 FL=1
MKKLSAILLMVTIAFSACNVDSNKPSAYHDNSNRADSLSGGVQLIPITTSKGVFNVWTKRVGNNPKIKVLLLHGGPGSTHEYFECFDSYFPKAEIEYYYYDQLGSAYSDNPNDTSLWNLPRFVEEVETVRKALGMDSSNFFLLGHSWGGILATEYALKYQKNLKGLIISNMVPSIPDYVKYANEVLGPKLPAEVLAQIRAFEAKGDYINIKTSIKNYLVHSTLKKIEDKLPSNMFFRVHRSFVINFSEIVDIEDNTVLVKQDIVPISRSLKSELIRKLNRL